MAIAFDFVNHEIGLSAPHDTLLLMQDLIDAIRTEEATFHGIQYPKIASASGKQPLGGSKYTGITVQLISPWQLVYPAGSYRAEIEGGNLVGGLGGQPVAYSAGVQVVITQAADSTIVATGGSALTTEEHNQLMGLPSADDVWEYERA